MKITSYLVLLLISACTTAQNFKIIEAIHYTRIGGVKGSRGEVFELKLKNNPQINPTFLLFGETKIPLNKEIKNGIIHLNGIYFSENPGGPEYGANPTPLILDYKNAYLLIENKSNKKQIKQKVILTSINKNTPINDKVPE